MKKRAGLALLVLLGFGSYRFRRSLLARPLKLPAPRHAVSVWRNIPVPMPDGVSLLADHYSPADVVAAGEPIPFYRDVLAHDQPDDPFWTARDHSDAVAQVPAPVHLVGGWYDYYLRGLLRNYAILKTAGRRPYLTIGPWHHAHPGGMMAGLVVLCYTTPPLTRDVEVIDPVGLELFVRSSLPRTDFFGRLCDVAPDGCSTNVCDGLFRIEPGRGEAQPDGSPSTGSGHA